VIKNLSLIKFIFSFTSSTPLAIFALKTISNKAFSFANVKNLKRFILKAKNQFYLLPVNQD
jgi:hypothetical protein